MKIKKGTFVEIDFTARIKDGKIFDSTRKNDAQKAGLIDEKAKQNHKFESLLICIGEGMVIKGFDSSLIDKETGKEYQIEIQPKEAFGIRKGNLIKTVSLSAFEEKPQLGMFVNVNGLVAKVITITGGRVLIDLNNPLAGKIVVYNFKINKIIEDNTEKIKILGKNFGLDIENIKIEDKKVKIKIKDKDKKIKLIEKFEKKMKELLKIEYTFE